MAVIIRQLRILRDRALALLDRCGIGCLVLLCTILAGVYNYRFIYHVSEREMVTMNDVDDIINGFHRSPTLWLAFRSYLSEPWIQATTYCFRPLSGCQYWVETYVGLHYGFLWDALFGFALFVACAVLAGLIAYRLTGSKLGALIASVLCCVCRFYNAGSQPYWLAWYPVHQDILMMVFLLGAILAFDVWFQSRTRGSLVMAWVCFILGCLTKEYVYIFPFYMAVIALLRPAESLRKRFPAMLQTAYATLVISALMVYRKHLFAHPRDPHFFRPGVYLHKPLLFMYNVIGRRIIAHDYWFVGFAVLLAALIGLAFIVRNREIQLGVFGKLYVWFPALLTTISVYFWLTLGSPMIGFWVFFDEPAVARTDLVVMLCLIYTMVLVVKYRRGTASVPAYFFLFLSYLPVISFIGWHYSLPGAMMRGPYWAVLAQLFWKDTAGFRREVALRYLPPAAPQEPQLEAPPFSAILGKTGLL